MASGVLRVAFAAALTLLAARGAQAQNDIVDRLPLDKLQITSLGVAYGEIFPSQVRPARLFAIQADYGNISPTWRVVFGASYWESKFEPDIVQAFVDSLHKSLADSTDHVVPSTVRLYDVTFSGDVRYTPNYSGELKPFLGVGLAAHIINAEGALINGTFVERSLDDIAAGMYVTGGFSMKLLAHFGIDGAVRADLLSGFRSTQIRAGATYYFGHIRGQVTPSNGAGKSPR